jgi:hypothetical protein
VTLLTQERGKLRTVAKGARKIKSRKAGHLEPFTHVTLQLAAGRDLPIITQAETIDAYLPLRDDLLRTGYAAYVLELVDRFTYDMKPATGLYAAGGDSRPHLHRNRSLAGRPLLRDAPARIPRLPTAPVLLRELPARAARRGPVLLGGDGWRHLPALRGGAAGAVAAERTALKYLRTSSAAPTPRRPAPNPRRRPRRRSRHSCRAISPTCWSAR